MWYRWHVHVSVRWLYLNLGVFVLHVMLHFFIWCNDFQMKYFDEFLYILLSFTPRKWTIYQMCGVTFEPINSCNLNCNTCKLPFDTENSQLYVLAGTWLYQINCILGNQYWWLACTHAMMITSCHLFIGLIL